ncbi:hypothetical protein FRB94_008487 [Tulasnella sp. JGI-2019a]|nr:hypothetical protein FRB93_010847 [Tulasnella sp. JGI-2019a]KAG9011416.1 hypothetical protein FRB94_008487 [Tulasnella sp. JGI-2019a]
MEAVGNQDVGSGKPAGQVSQAVSLIPLAACTLVVDPKSDTRGQHLAVLSAALHHLRPTTSIRIVRPLSDEASEKFQSVIKVLDEIIESVVTIPEDKGWQYRLDSTRFEHLARILQQAKKDYNDHVDHPAEDKRDLPLIIPVWGLNNNPTELMSYVQLERSAALYRADCEHFFERCAHTDVQERSLIACLSLSKVKHIEEEYIHADRAMADAQRAIQPAQGREAPPSWIDFPEPISIIEQGKLIPATEQVEQKTEHREPDIDHFNPNRAAQPATKAPAFQERLASDQSVTNPSQGHDWVDCVYKLDSHHPPMRFFYDRSVYGMTLVKEELGFVERR